MSQLAADNLCIIVGPLRVSNSAPCSRDEDFHSTFPLVGTSYQTNITISIVSICRTNYIENECTKVQNPRRPRVRESITRVRGCWKGTCD